MRDLETLYGIELAAAEKRPEPLEELVRRAPYAANSCFTNSVA